MTVYGESIGASVRTTAVLLAVWCLVSTLEWTANFGLFRKNGLLSWQILSLRPGASVRSVLAHHVFQERGMAFVLIARIAAAVTLLVASQPKLLCPALLVLVTTYWLISVRTWLGGDGSDQMGQIVSVGLLLATFGISIRDDGVALSGTLLIAGQLTISYFVAGFSKLISPIWRCGAAVAGVMATHSYGHDIAARVSGQSRAVSIAVCWAVILGETLFPLALFAPERILTMALVAFAVFHLSNAFFMGLNGFVWSFFATYPSVLVLNQLIRLWLHARGG